MELEIKLNCPCGVRYGFTVVPENGRMPVDVACPSCQADGTPAANAVIRQRLAESIPRPAVRVVLPGQPPRPPAVPTPGNG